MAGGARAADVPRGGRAAWSAVLVLAAFNALWRLGRADWKLDENVYARAGWAMWHGDASQTPEHPPLGKLLLGLGQVLFGRTAFGVRMVPALFFLAGVVAVFLLGRRMAGWWTGVVAAGLYAVLPRSLVVDGHQVAAVRVDRYGFLEAIAGPLLVAALLAGWRWVTGGGRRWALAAGVLAGLAGASKLTGLVVLAPIVVVGAALRWGRRDLGPQVGLLVGGAAVALLAPFLVHGTDAPHAIGAMFRAQEDHARVGHLLVLGGSVWDKSPWWANLRYSWDADGPILSLALLAGVASATVVSARRRPAAAYLLASLLGLIGALALSPVALPHYRAIWTGPLVLLVALGTVDLLGRVRVPVRAVGAAILAVLALFGAATTVRVGTLPDGDYRRMAREIAATGQPVERIVSYSDGLQRYFDGSVEVLAFLDDGRTRFQVLVLDPSLTDAVGPDAVAQWRGWARAWGLKPHRIGSLEGWWAG